jgi:PAS domain S-box-containing protein
MQYRVHNRVFKTLTIIFSALLGVVVLLLSTDLPINYALIVVVLILILIYILREYRIRRPLALIQKALNADNPVYVEKLLTSKDEFGQIAALVKRTYQQREVLLAEITERKRIEEILRESEERYRSVVETSPEMILVMDLNANVLISNLRAAALFDSSGASESRNFFNFFQKREQTYFKNVLQDLMKSGRISNIETNMLKQNNNEFSAEISLSLLKNQEGNPYSILAIVKDISDKKTAELEKAVLEEQFRAVYKMEAIGQLAGGIAHDFNNILGAISGYADIIKTRYSEDEKLLKYSSMIISAATRASELTKKLLTFARKSKLQMIAFNIHDLLRDAKDLLEHTIDKNIVITSDFLAKDSIIIGDSSQFQSAVMNLGLNARDAMPNGGTLHIKTGNITIDTEYSKTHAYTIAPGYYTYVSISDTGTGMDKQVMKHLFEPFFTTKDIGKGTGLGLASVYGTVKSHSGYIDVSSEPGNGSIFTLYFPASHQTLGEEPRDPDIIHKGNATIMVVDDESFMRDALKEMLSWLGYNVFTASNGDEAIEIVSKNHLDLIIFDMIMPGMNGRNCFKQIRTFNKTVRALLSTGIRIDDERINIMNEGFSGIIQKPFVSAQLAQAVFEALK